MTKILGESVYEVENMMSHKIEQVNAARMLIYRSELDNAVLSDSLKRTYGKQ